MHKHSIKLPLPSLILSQAEQIIAGKNKRGLEIIDKSQFFALIRTGSAKRSGAAVAGSDNKKKRSSY